MLQVWSWLCPLCQPSAWSLGHWSPPWPWTPRQYQLAFPEGFAEDNIFHFSLKHWFCSWNCVWLVYVPSLVSSTTILFLLICSWIRITFLFPSRQRSLLDHEDIHWGWPAQPPICHWGHNLTISTWQAFFQWGDHSWWLSVDQSLVYSMSTVYRSGVSYVPKSAIMWSCALNLFHLWPGDF